MTNEEILAKMPCGEVVRSKQVLSALKRKGLIYDYSYWGYLESARIRYKDPDDSWYYYVETFPKGNAKDANDFSGTSEELRKKFFGGDINYLGFTFDTKYLDGCIMPYLVKTGPKTEKVVNRSMCLWGAIV